MPRIESVLDGAKRRPLRIAGSRLASAFAVVAGCLIAAGAAFATDGEPPPLKQFPLAQIFTFLFLMLGPFKIIGPFAKITRGADARLTRQIAILATVFAAIALLIAAFLGESVLITYGVPIPVLALSAGIILFLVALRTILEQFDAPEPHDEHAPPPAAPTLKAALSPLAFPTIVTPYGIAALVVFLALSHDTETRLTVGAIVVAIMVLNLIVMLVTRRLLPVLALVLPILGAILGVVQVALGLQIINNSLRAMGVL
jgi:multiple antibiotic resistance protein